MSNDEVEQEGPVVMRGRSDSETRMKLIKDIQKSFEMNGVTGSSTEDDIESYYNSDSEIYVCMSNTNAVITNSEMDSENVYVEMKGPVLLDPIKSTCDEILQKCQCHKLFLPEYSSNVKPLKGNRNHLVEYPYLDINTLNPDLFYCAKLREDATHSGGVEVEIPLDYLVNTYVSIVDWKICITKCPKEPNNNSKVYIGDRIISLNNIVINSILDFKKIIMKIERSSIVKVLLQRLPYAKIFLVNTENSESIIKFKENKEIWILNNIGKSVKPTQFDIWFMTEVDGIVTENISTQKVLKKRFSKGQDRYIPVIMHSQWFVNKILTQ